MKTRFSTTIEPGDLVHHHQRLWLAATFDPSRPCDIQCAMSDGEGRCCGYCWRWENGEDVVFRFILPDMAVKEATEVVDTPDLLDEAIAGGDPRKASILKYYRKKQRKRQDAEPRPHGTGSLWQSLGGMWRAEIHICGTTVHRSSRDKAEVEQWLDEMVKKREALKELERMKGAKK